MAEFQYTNLDRCCHLIFDDADQTFETHDSEVAAIMAIYRAVHDAHRDLIDQVVVTANAWTESIRSFMSKFLMSSPEGKKTGPAIGISSMLDAAVYGKIRNSICQVQREREAAEIRINLCPDGLMGLPIYNLLGSMLQSKTCISD